MNKLDNSTQATISSKGKAPPVAEIRENNLVRDIVSNPKMPAYKHYMNHWPTNNPETARTEVAQVLAKPRVKMKLAKYNGLAENTLIKTINDFGNSDSVAKRSLAVNVAKYVHDKIHGTATNRLEADITTDGQQITPVAIDVVQQFGLFLKDQTR